ncbi:formate/nitrite transporter family protein [Paraglaciecola sp. L1A13]|uniref:formate/nitrite transporter family protein n=1 Tax=Paraglaciecola sp. L1A13 TaxID=2686359 RepID=UPI00131C8E8A|nr:formate/nitrite transporter family protein [Paraglaciecola sp. L1A13]
MPHNSVPPAAQFIASRDVAQEICKEACEHIHTLSAARILVLAMLGGAFITMGALFSILLSTGVEAHGIQLLLQGLGFSVGFFLVILTGAALFTEANVILPVSALNCSRSDMLRRGLKFWILAWIGNLLGAVLTGWVISIAQVYSPEHYALLNSVIAKKMHYQQVGGVEGWFSLMLSGMLGNWMVGMAAFLAVMGRTIIDKFVPIFLAVSLFVAGNFQHSPANMAYFSMSMPLGDGPGWWDAMLWNIIPAGIGNILGGSLLVALPLWYALSSKR